MFNSPDGMVIDATGLIWIQTDGDDSNEGDFEGQGNNQMLVGDPTNSEIHCFLTGPFGCEVMRRSSVRRMPGFSSECRRRRSSKIVSGVLTPPSL